MDAPLAPRDAKLQRATNQVVRGCLADGDSGNSVSTESDVPRKARILGIAAREPNLLPSGISEGPVEPCAKFISRPPPPAEGIAPSSSVRNGAISRVSVCIADRKVLQGTRLETSPRDARQCGASPIKPSPQRVETKFPLLHERGCSPCPRDGPRSAYTDRTRARTTLSAAGRITLGNTKLPISKVIGALRQTARKSL